jgi:hypothetical protein
MEMPWSYLIGGSNKVSKVASLRTNFGQFL